MKRQEPEGRVHPDKLLDLWLGQPRETAEPTGALKRLPLGVTVAVAVTAAAGIILLLKFAVDVLAVALVVVVAGLLLHGLAMRLADSGVLSPAALLLIVLGVGILGYVFLLPNVSADALSKHMPAWLVDTLEWSEKHGWGRTVLIGPLRDEATSSEAASTAPAPAPLRDSLPSAHGLPSLAVTASSTSLRSGQHVTLTARAATLETRPLDGRARFYDYETRLATVGLQPQGGTGIASLVVGGLAVGRHEIRARFIGPLGRTGPLSEPLIVTVSEK